MTMDRIIDKSVAEADDFSELDINSRQKNTPPETGSRDVLIGGNCCEKGDNTESAPGFSKDQKAESDDNTNTKYGSIEKGDAEMEAVEDKETPEEEDKLHNIDVSDINSEKDLKERSLDGVQENQTQNKDDVDTFAFISEQLNFLNNESGVLTTHIHKSDGQMQEEKGKQGVKRRLDTSSIFGSKKEKRVKLDNTDGKVHADSSDEWIDVDSSDDSSSEDGWKIIVDSESELDKKLEEGAKKNKLSATNVKNILHHVITNEHVIAMVKNTLNEELNKQEQSLNETFEPKMTRSKVKQVLEKEGNVPHPWPLSPLKKSKTPPPNFLDLTFSEEDDDEEYEPLKDKEERNDSDEDAESCISSQLSDVMSPYSSEPSTPQSIQISDLDKTPGDGALIIASPVMGPPTKLMTPKRTLLGKKYLKAMSSEESTLSSGESDDQIIALRTRSRLPLTETSLIEIESNFVSPDITPDMYDTHCDDGDWQAFLKSLVTEKETVDVADDETNDPEYNYLEEADNEEMDEEDFRHDRAVRITKKELNGLMDELFEAYGDIDGLNEADKEFIKAQAQDSAMSRNKPLNSVGTQYINVPILPQLLPDQKNQLDEQMRKHVQLLTQTFILSQSSTDYNLAADIAKHMLNELYRFSNVLSPVPDSTAYRAYNLEEAVNIVNEDRDWVSKSPDISPKWRPLTVQRLRKHGFENVPLKSSCIYPPQLLPLTTTQKDVIYNSRVFMYPELLPKGGFLRSSELNKEKRRITFTKAEDGLIALGLEQFKPFPKYLKWIRKLMMPCKTQDQLRIRIKNLTASKSQDNIVKYYKKNKKLPECSRQYAIFNENDILAPKEQPNDSRPVWIADYEESMRALEDEAAECSIPLVASLDRRRASSITLPVIGDPPTPLSSNMEAASAWSAPVSPVVILDVANDVGNDESKSLTPKTQKKLKSLLRYHQRKKKRIQRKPLNSFLNLGELNTSSLQRTATTSPLTVKGLSKDDKGLILSSCNKELDQPLNKNSAEKSADATSSCSQPVTCVLPVFVVGEPIMSHERRTSTNVEPSAATGTVMTAKASERLSVPGALHKTPQKSVQTSYIPVAAKPDGSTYTPVIISPFKPIDVNHVQTALTPQQKILETTPTKGSPGISHLSAMSPKMLSFSPTKLSKVTPTKSSLKKLNDSPIRQYLQAKSKQARNLLSKGFVLNSRISPVKIAAYSLRNRARRQMYSKSPVNILPKPPTPVIQLPASVPPIPRNTQMKELSKTVVRSHEIVNGDDMLESENVSDVDDEMEQESRINKVGINRRKNRLLKSSSDLLKAESDDTQSETDDMGLSQYDSQNEEEVLDGQEKDGHLATLMEASTTIGFTSKKHIGRDKGIKAKKRKEMTLSMLAPDLIQSDPYRDERDTLFAQDYLARVKEATKDDLDTYERFLKLLYEFGKGGQSPVELYRLMLITLEKYPEMASDFSGFLLPEQAIECNCFMSNLDFAKSRAFLRKIELYYYRHPNHFQKVMRIFSKWANKPERTPKELRDLLEPMLKGQPHLMEELSSFFADVRVPESYLTEFEEVRLGDSDEETQHVFDGFEEVQLPDDDVNSTKKCRCACHYNTTDENCIKRIRHCQNCSLKVIDGELYYRINNKTLKKVNVIFHTPLQSDVPAEQPVEPANFQDDETAEKENVEVHQSEPRKNKSPSRPRISIKLKIPKKKKGKGRFYSLTEMSDSPEKISELGTDKDRETRSDLIIDRPGMEETVEHSESPMIPERNSSTEGEQTPAQHLELSAEELGIEVLKQDANTIVFQLKACDNEHGVTNFHSSENVSNLLNQQIGNTVFVPSLEKGTSAETTIHKDSASGLPLPNLCVVPSCQEAILDHGMPNRNSKIQLDILSEDANTSPQKRIQNEFLGENSNFGFFVQENSNSDILEKAFKSAMMGQGDISIDNSSLLRMLASPVKTSSPSKSSGSYNIHYTTETSSPNKFSCMASQSHNCEQNSDQINFSVSESVDHENVKPVEASQFSLNLSDVIENEKSLSSHHNNSGSGNPVSGIKCEKEANSSSSSQAESTDTSQKGSSISKDKVSNDTDSETEDVWTREADKALLEACKSAGSGEKTFKLISKALGNKTQIQVERRFLRLMELFAEIETPSEDEDSFENSK